MIDVKKSRFRDASWFEKVDNFTIPIVIGGVGGIGSWLTMFLSRILSDTSYLILYDHDKVEEVNIAGQLYRTKDVGKMKVEAMKEIMRDFSGYEKIMFQPEKFDSESIKSPIMFSAFDNMKARKDMFNSWKNESQGYAKDSIFIDGRLLAEQFQVYYVTPETAGLYETDALFDDSEVDDVSCSYKQTTHFAAMISGKMVQGCTNWLAGDELPFRYEEIGNLFLSEIKP